MIPFWGPTLTGNGHPGCFIKIAKRLLFYHCIWNFEAKRLLLMHCESDIELFFPKSVTTPVKCFYKWINWTKWIISKINQKLWKIIFVLCSYCPIHVVTFTLISLLVTDYIQKRRGQSLLFSFEYNLLPNLISK